MKVCRHRLGNLCSCRQIFPRERKSSPDGLKRECPDSFKGLKDLSSWRSQGDCCRPCRAIIRQQYNRPSFESESRLSAGAGECLKHRKPRRGGRSTGASSSQLARLPTSVAFVRLSRPAPSQTTLSALPTGAPQAVAYSSAFRKLSIYDARSAEKAGKRSLVRC